MIIGTHIILDLYNINKTTFEKVSKKKFESFDKFIEKIIKDNNATLLNKVVNHFNDDGAFTSLYLLAESHISIHTWPENNFIAIDVFTCGKTNTENIANELNKYFQPEYYVKNIYTRGGNFTAI
jgi:S-adenosylmethionine decarboxylase